MNLRTGAERRLARSLSLVGVLFVSVVSVPAFAQDAAARADAAGPSDTASPGAEEPSPAADSAELATARLHFANGVDLLQSSPPNYQDAYRQFELALEKSGRSWKVLGNLGLCALKLERDGEALAFYSEYLEKGGDDVDPAERKEIERELLLLKGNLITLSLESSDPNAKISVKRQGSNAPTQLYSLEGGKADLGLRSGSLTIMAQSKEEVLEWSTVLSAGETAAHVFDFDALRASDKSGSGAAGATSPSPGQASSKPSGLRIAGYATLGGGVLMAGGGLVFGLMSQSKESKANDSCINSVCEEATQDDFDSAKSMATVANVLFIGGGVLAATGVTLVIFGGSKSSDTGMMRPSLALSPAPTAGGGGLFAAGRF